MIQGDNPINAVDNVEHWQVFLRNVLDMINEYTKEEKSLQDLVLLYTNILILILEKFYFIQLLN